MTGSAPELKAVPRELPSRRTFGIIRSKTELDVDSLHAPHRLERRGTVRSLVRHVSLTLQRRTQELSYPPGIVVGDQNLQVPSRISMIRGASACNDGASGASNREFRERSNCWASPRGEPQQNPPWR